MVSKPSKITTDQVRLQSRRLVREFDLVKGEYLDTGCTLAQCHVLFELQQNPGLTLLELAGKLLIDKSNASRTVKKLIQTRLVRSKSDLHDQRQKRFNLTAKGEKVLISVLQVANEQTNAALRHLDPAEQAKVIEGMELYANALRKSRLQKGFSIRPIRKKDNANVAATIRTVMTEFGAVGEGFSIVDPEVDRMFENYRGSNRACYFVVEKDQQILGCGGVARLIGGASDTCELRKMFYRPEARGRGLGKLMLLKILERAKEFGYKECYIETLTRMDQAIGLYVTCGFQEIQKPMGNTGHGRCDRWFLKKLTSV